MAKDTSAEAVAARTKQKQELETLQTDFRTVVGRAIVGGLLKPGHAGVGGMGNFVLKGPDYDQDSGDYTQSGGGDHEQNSGNYTQGP